MVGFSSGTLCANNVDFTGASVSSGTPQVNSNGQLLIGNASAPNIRVGTLTSPDGTVVIGYSTPNITLSAPGSTFYYRNVTHAMSPYTVVATDFFLSVDCSGGVVTLNFPNAPTAYTRWVVKDRTGNAAASNITITTPGGSLTFDGSTSYVMNANYQAVDILANTAPTYEIF